MTTISSAEEHPAALDLLDRGRDLRATAGDPGAGGVEVSSMRWCSALRWTVSE